MKAGNRWVIAIAGVFLQIALGAVYAWSVFRIPLSKQFGWSISQVTFTFTISIFVLGFAAFFGGLWMNRVGPRTVALTAGTFYGLGVFLASFSANKLWWLYLSYGVIGGIGLGLGYIVPVATLVKWFPDRRGLITGIAVGGFGAGALITAPVATRLIQTVGVLRTFAYLGVAYFIVTIIAGGMVGVASLGNGGGRVFWAWLSDLITRRGTFIVMFIVQVLLFWFLPTITVPSIMTTVTFVILMCYGGGFGTMPAFTADYFGPKNVGPIYGLMLTALSFASVFGPLYIARMRETTGNYSGALPVIAIVMFVSVLLPIIVRPPRRDRST